MIQLTLNLQTEWEATGEMRTSSSPVASPDPANPTPLQESEKAKKMRDTSGLRCLEQLERFSRIGSWGRMFLASLIGQEGWYSTKCKLTWKLRGTKYSRLYCQLAVSTLPIKEKGFGLSLSEKTKEAMKKVSIEMGLLPTPTIQEVEHPEAELTETNRRKSKNGNSHSLNLVDSIKLLPTITAHGADRNTNFAQGGTCLKNGLIKQGLLPTIQTQGLKVCNQGKTEFLKINLFPTPDCSDRRSDKSKQQGLSNVMKGLIPTPKGNDFRSGMQNRFGTKHTQQLNDTMAFHNGKTSQLNPRFVAEMMGFPADWTELPFLNGETKV
jgi:hypothetical protein